LERDFQLKKAMGFPAETFTRCWKLLRLEKRGACSASGSAIAPGG
jgi:hypothetical protein